MIGARETRETRRTCGLRAIAIAVVALAGCARRAPDAGYVPTARCLACHPAEAARWLGSHHAQAMAVATAASVRAAPGAEPVPPDGGAPWRLERAGDAHALISPDGGRHPVRYTLGVAPLQQYLVDGPGGRLQVAPVAWDPARGAWFRVPGDDLAWTGRGHTANTLCVDCHATGVARGYDADRDAFATTFAAVGVDCQACHGPGAAHAADPRARVPARADVEACAPCHARRSPLGAPPAAPGPLFDAARPMTLLPGLYFADGQLRDEVFEYGSFAQSAMHEAGVRCVDCHDPHGGRGADDNTRCTRCHRAAPPRQAIAPSTLALLRREAPVVFQEAAPGSIQQIYIASAGLRGAEGRVRQQIDEQRRNIDRAATEQLQVIALQRNRIGEPLAQAQEVAIVTGGVGILDAGEFGIAYGAQGIVPQRRVQVAFTWPGLGNRRQFRPRQQQPQVVRRDAQPTVVIALQRAIAAGLPEVLHQRCNSKTPVLARPPDQKMLETPANARVSTSYAGMAQSSPGGVTAVDAEMPSVARRSMSADNGFTR